MKALILALAGAATVAAAAPASASVVTLGNSFARSCYLAADARVASHEAISDCDRAFTEQPLLTHDDRVATHVNRGILLMFAGDAARARADFDTAIALDPTEAEAWLNKGVLLFNQDDVAGAMPMFEKALQLRTNSPALAYFGRGLANEQLGNVKAAYADLLRARALRPDWDEPVKELARYEVRRR